MTNESPIGHQIVEILVAHHGHPLRREAVEGVFESGPLRIDESMLETGAENALRHHREVSIIACIGKVRRRFRQGESGLESPAPTGADRSPLEQGTEGNHQAGPERRHRGDSRIPQQRMIGDREYHVIASLEHCRGAVEGRWNTTEQASRLPDAAFRLVQQLPGFRRRLVVKPVDTARKIVAADEENIDTLDTADVGKIADSLLGFDLAQHKDILTAVADESILFVAVAGGPDVAGSNPAHPERRQPAGGHHL